MNWHDWRRSLLLFGMTVLLTISLSTGRSTAQHSPPTVTPQTAVSLTEQATALYTQGNYLDASHFWQQAIAAYEGNSLNQAMAWSNLSLTYQQLSRLPEAEQAITTSLDLLRYNPKISDTLVSHDRDYLTVLAPSLDIRGRLYWQQGNPQAALTTWQRSARLYRTLGGVHAEIQSQLNQVQALQALGNLTAAQKQLQQVEIMLAQQPSSRLKVELWRSLGNTYRLMGDLKTAENKLREALAFASPAEIPVINLELGNVAWAISNRARRIDTERKRKEAAEKTQQAFRDYTDASQSPELRLQATLNQLGLLLDAGDFAAADALGETLKGTMAKLPNDRPSLLAHLTYAHHLICLKRRAEKTIPLCHPAISSSANPKQVLAIDSLDWKNIAQRLATIAEEAKTIGDTHIASYARGTLGTLYELLEQPFEAMELTNDALKSSQAYQMGDLAYRWLWQRGRLLKHEGNRPGAIAAYKAAVDTLDPVRANLLPASSDVQFDFRDNVEPLYRELVDLLLQNPTQDNLKAAISYIDDLQLAEIEDHLRCNLAQRVQLNEGQPPDPHAAIIYSIILEDRLATIVQTSIQKEQSSQPVFQYYPYPIQGSRAQSYLKRFQQDLIDPSATPDVVKKAQEVYKWLMQKPMEKTLVNYPQINTLVFVLDDVLRNIPMGVLHDGTQFLLENEHYSLAVTPRVNLFPPQAASLFKIFTGGVGISQPDVEGENFYAIENLLPELLGISDSHPLLNEAFTLDNLQQKLQAEPFNAIHVKTHGRFSSDPDETFIVGYGKRIKGRDLAELIRLSTHDQVQLLDLLTLSACNTAKGDNRSVLGLAGIAVQTGARSTLSTLWTANDQSNTDLMLQFYHSLKESSRTKAQALRQAQLSLLKQGQNPHVWAPYVLVGSWL